MKNSNFTKLLLSILVIFTISCNKDTEDDPILNADSYFTAEINGNLWESENVIGGSFGQIFQFVAFDENGKTAFTFTLRNYTGIGNYNINENITIQYNDNIYQGKNSDAGIIKITYDNSLDKVKNGNGEFNCSISNLLNESDILVITDGKFQSSPD